MTNIYRVEGPAMISFSGGRTSAYMLRQVLDAYDNILPPDVHVLFANTGKERLETLEFVHECGRNWNVAIHWIEYDGKTSDGGFVEREFQTASRAGEPFERLIEARKYLPNPVTRFCTTELKIRPMRNWMRARGYDDAEWTNVVGIRADEPRRVMRMRVNNKEGRWDVAMPLADAGVTVADIAAFWNRQGFDLRLRQSEGNCDLCFLKGYRKRQNIIRDRPDLAVWWMRQEELLGKTFRRDTPSYAAMVAQQDLFEGLAGASALEDIDIIECACTD